MPVRCCLLPLTAALCASSAWAQSSGQETVQRDPVSVADRFERNNAPQGLQAGPWKVTPTLMLRGGYDDNITLSPDIPLSSPIVELRGRVDVVNESGQNSVALYGEVTETWYTDAADLNHLDWNAGGSFNAQVSNYVRIRGAIGVSETSSPDTATDGVVIGGTFDAYADLARYLSVPASLAITFDTGTWFATAGVDGTYSAYDDRMTEGGVLVDQGFRSGINANGSLRAGWRFTPGTALFVEGGYNIQRYDDDSADSDGWRAVAGAEFEFSRLLTGDVFAGYASQSYGGGGNVTGLTYGASLNWFATELMSLHLTARRDFGAERTALDVGGAVTSPVTRDSVRLGVEYEPLRQMLVRGEVGWEQSSYEGSNRTDQRFFTGLGFDYVFTPRLRVTLDYRYEERSSDIAGDASNNVFRLGIRTGY